VEGVARPESEVFHKPEDDESFLRVGGEAFQCVTEIGTEIGVSSISEGRKLN